MASKSSTSHPAGGGINGSPADANDVIGRRSPRADRHHGSGALTFVTVVFEEELNLLRLQARSLAAYLDPNIVQSIFVVGNFAAASPAADRMRRLLDEYGRLAPYVRFFRNFEVSPATGNDGWLTQQVLKLKIHAYVNTAFYVILDAKNHLIRPVGIADFLTRDNRIKSYLNRYDGHLMEDCFRDSFSYFGLDPDTYIRAAIPTITPFTIRTGIVKDMIRFIEKREGIDFATFFLRFGDETPPRNVTEFFMIMAFLIDRGVPLESLYRFGKANTVTLFKADVDRSRFKVLLKRARSDHIKFFAMHRVTRNLMSEEQKAAIAALWSERKLVSCPKDALEFLQAEARIVDA